jgi:MoxR-like ATPase
VRRRAHRADEHGIDAAAGARRRGRPARTAAEPRRDRDGGPAGRRGHRAAGRPQRVTRLQAPPRPGADPAGTGEGIGLSDALRSPEAIGEALARERYLADRPLDVSLFLAATLGQPLLVEGEAGVGKTEVAKALAAATGARLIRLQCHEGIDVHQALYDWDWQRQLLALRAAEGGVDEGALFSRRFLLRRPLLEALEEDGPVVLLIDEVDRADDAFEAFLLELLSDFQVTIPELGTIRAAGRPLVVLTSNRTRELHDALKRRCLYHWIDYPTREREGAIVRARAPGVEEAITARVCDAVARLREADLYKLPGVGETIAWARALHALGATDGAAALEATLGVALKVREDLDRVRAEGVLDGV